MKTCPYCNKSFVEKGIGTHIWRIHEKGIDFDPNKGFKEGRVQWNVGLTKETSAIVKKYSETNSKNTTGRVGIPHTAETKQILSEKLSRNNNGGRCKWFKYTNNKNEEISLQGTWEVRFAKILEQLDEDWIKITIKHSVHSFKWRDVNNNLHTYTPDFYSIKNNIYYEVKGFWWGNDKEKMRLVIEQNPSINIEIIDKEKLYFLEKLYKTNIKKFAEVA